MRSDSKSATRVGLEPGPLGPAGHVCRVRGRRRMLAPSDARRRQRRGGRRLCAGRHHRTLGTGPRRQACKRRNAVRQRRHRRRWLDGRADGQGARRARDHHGRQRRKSEAVPASWVPTWQSTTRRTTSRPVSKRFAPDGVNVWWETLREPNFDQAVALLAPRGRMILMAGRDARPVSPSARFT